jgi:hypothetical protein
VADEPVVTDYPHDRLSRLADAMTAVLGRIPEVGDVRSVVLLNDRDNGASHLHGYPESPEGQALVFYDLAMFLAERGRALGMRVDILLDGQPVTGSG